LRRGHRRLERLVEELRCVVRKVDSAGGDRTRGGPARSLETQLGDPPLRARRLAPGELEAERKPRVGSASPERIAEVPDPPAAERVGTGASVPLPATPRPSPDAEVPAGTSRLDHPAGSDASRDERGGELADALAAAVERLQARATASDPLEEDPPLPAGETRPPVVAMSPSHEPLRSRGEISWWGAWRARRLARRRR
jgi:hypothetical protein